MRPASSLWSAGRWTWRKRPSREAKIWQSPDLTVLMVGGSTYIPLVRRLLQERFPWLDSKTQVVQRLPDQGRGLGLRPLC